jgi:hypothetical protein
MLMIGSQNTGRDDISIIAGFSGINQAGGKDTRCSSLELDGTVLMEDPGEDVFVVADCDDALEDECTSSSYYSYVCSPVSVFPSDSSILLFIMLVRRSVFVGIDAPAREDRSRLVLRLARLWSR